MPAHENERASAYSYFTQSILVEKWQNRLLVTIVAKYNANIPKKSCKLNKNKKKIHLPYMCQLFSPLDSSSLMPPIKQATISQLSSGKTGIKCTTDRIFSANGSMYALNIKYLLLLSTT
jgi:hypothetical protein